MVCPPTVGNLTTCRQLQVRRQVRHHYHRATDCIQPQATVQPAVATELLVLLQQFGWFVRQENSWPLTWLKRSIFLVKSLREMDSRQVKEQLAANYTMPERKVVVPGSFRTKAGNPIAADNRRGSHRCYYHTLHQESARYWHQPTALSGGRRDWGRARRYLVKFNSAASPFSHGLSQYGVPLLSKLQADQKPPWFNNLLNFIAVCWQKSFHKLSLASANFRKDYPFFEGGKKPLEGIWEVRMISNDKQRV